MPVVIWEDPESPTFEVGPDATAERLYHALDSAGDGEAAVYAAATAESPYWTNGMPRKSVSCKPRGGPLWEVRVGYADGNKGDTPIANNDQLPDNPSAPPPPPPPPIPADRQPASPGYIGGTGADDGSGNPLGGVGLGDPADPGYPEAPSQDGQPSPNDAIGEGYQFEASVGTVKVTKSLSTVHRLKATGVNATDLKGLIGPKQDGELEGCEVPVGKFEWSVTRPIRAISLAYLRSLSRAVGKVNDGAWYGWAAGELMFMGASGTYERSKGWSITFKFDAAENETNVVVSPTITVPTKDGHDYLWVGIRMEDNPDGAGAFPPLVPVVKAAYVERVIKRVNFVTYLGF